MANDFERKYISIADAKNRYSLGRTALYELFHKPECPQLRRHGKKILIPVEEFDAFMDKNLGYVNYN